jgi:DNA (cytosine-5)-methyltransferase 1
MVRRLTPVECARLQGFPDDYLDVSFRGKPAADGNKYRALGNSMAVPVMAWIGRRIEEVSELAPTIPRRRSRGGASSADVSCSTAKLTRRHVTQETPDGAGAFS